jgi:uncharacterized iron-regulated membrane protein
MRPFWTFLHRWVGLLTALFLIVSGLTGAVISWDHELDDLLNPHLMEAKVKGPALPSLELARLVEERHPQVRVSFLPLAVEPGETLHVFVRPRVDPATGKLYEPGFNQVFIDPASGEELGKREWGAVWPVTRENFVSFLYKFHYSLHLPEMWGIDRWGLWLLGVVAILWTLDCFVALLISFPKGQPWRRSFLMRWKTGGYRLNFDLHRAVSLWTWGLLLIVAFTGFSLNLYREVFLPVMSMFSQVTPTPFTARTPTPKHQPITPKLGFADAIRLAKAEAGKRGWTEPAGSVFYSPNYGLYGVQFFHPEADHGVGGGGHKRLYYDGQDGRYVGDKLPWSGTAADLFVQAQFPLHSGRILGLPGRILISIMGVVVAMLSITGLVIWWRKLKARRQRHAGLASPPSASPVRS